MDFVVGKATVNPTVEIYYSSTHTFKPTTGDLLWDLCHKSSISWLHQLQLTRTRHGCNKQSPHFTVRFYVCIVYQFSGTTAHHAIPPSVFTLLFTSARSSVNLSVVVESIHHTGSCKWQPYFSKGAEAENHMTELLENTEKKKKNWQQACGEKL